MSFWQNLKKPLVGLSPMDGITDEPMRFIQKKYGAPDLIFTEFINVEHIPHQPEKLLARFLFSPLERPVVAQLSGHTPDLFYKAALSAAYLGFDGIDINMGCPVKSVTAGGGGAALIENRALAQEIVLMVKKALDDWQKGIDLEKALGNEDWWRALLKIKEKNQTLLGGKEKFARGKLLNAKKEMGLSVKTRLGRNSRATKAWIDFLSQLPIEAIILHGRRPAQEHQGRVFWPEIARAAVGAHKMKKIFLGNGGITNRGEGERLSRRWRLDGVLIGRAALGNPWIFTSHQPNRQERMAVLKEHTLYFHRLFGPKAFIAMRKHFGWYCRDFPEAKRIKVKLQQTKTLNQALAIIEKF